nr:MAG TPA: hypothetical protein [Bacteriophage sp.]
MIYTRRRCCDKPRRGWQEVETRATPSKYKGKNINRKCGDANVRKRHEIQKAV